MPPSSGTVDVDGYSVADHSFEVRKKIGYLPELNPLYHDMNVVEYLEYAAQLHGSTSADETTTRHMIEVCVSKTSGTKISERCRKDTQRVGLAQAMIHDLMC